MSQSIYRRHEISIANFLLRFQNDLRNEYLAYHTDFFDGALAKGEIINPGFDVNTYVSSVKDWKTTALKYSLPGKPYIISTELEKVFPTASKLTNYFGDDCPVSTYSSIEPGTIIYRHVGPDHYFQESKNNLQMDFVRIHIPLVIPEGDVFFEVAGEEIKWDDIFAFDNQKIHSAYNFSTSRRLVYILDIRRNRIGMPPGEFYTKEQEKIDMNLPLPRQIARQESS
jgi:Aspartyl/Asparaginyl beta-hydroxylase